MDDSNIKFSNALRIKERIPFLQFTDKSKNYQNWIDRKSLVKPENQKDIVTKENQPKKSFWNRLFGN